MFRETNHGHELMNGWLHSTPKSFSKLLAKIYSPTEFDATQYVDPNGHDQLVYALNSQKLVKVISPILIASSAFLLT